MGFDFDHTLGIDNKLERVAFLHLLDEACARGGQCVGTLAEEIERIDALLVAQRSGRFTIETAVDRFMRERCAPHGQWASEYKDLCLDMVEALVIPAPDARPTLAELRERGVRTAILTNGWSPLQQRKAARVGFRGEVLVSADIGIQKPERAAFAALAHALQCEPGHIAYVGDTPKSDIAGALSAGMQGIWLDAEGATYPPEVAAPTAVIHSLAELLALV